MLKTGSVKSSHELETMFLLSSSQTCRLERWQVNEQKHQPVLASGSDFFCRDAPSWTSVPARFCSSGFRIAMCASSADRNQDLWLSGEREVRAPQKAGLLGCRQAQEELQSPSEVSESWLQSTSPRHLLTTAPWSRLPAPLAWNLPAPCCYRRSGPCWPVGPFDL